MFNYKEHVKVNEHGQLVHAANTDFNVPNPVTMNLQYIIIVIPPALEH